MEPQLLTHARDPSRRFFIFDMFGTLVANCPAGQTSADPLACFYPDVPEKDLREAYFRLTREFKETHRNRELPFMEIVAFLDGAFGCSTDQDAIEYTVLRRTGSYTAADGAEDALRYLKGRGYRIGVLSNSRFRSRAISRILEEEGLSGYVDVLVSSADTGIRKPDPAQYQMAASALGAVPKDCYFCGDSDSNDYYGPLQAGFRGAVHIGDGDPGIRYRVGRIGDLPSLFADRCWHTGGYRMPDGTKLVGPIGFEPMTARL